MNFKREIIAKIRLLFRSMKAKRAKKKLLEERDDALGRCASEERLLMFKLTLRLAFALLKEMGEIK